MEENPRRSFFKKLGSGIIAGVGASTGLSMINSSDKITDMNPILESKPMGFIWDTYDPFLFCVHHEDKFPVGNSEMGPEASFLQGRKLGDDFMIRDGFRMYHGETVPGFPGHPHRGFETVTVVREGIVDHSDSQGAAGRYGEGDVQWMTAGKGVQHAEMFPLIHDDKPNPMELFQIWLNLPQKNKMVEPHFKMLWGKDIPRYTKDGADVEVIAGSLGGYTAPQPPPDSWAANPVNSVAIYNVKLEKGAKITLPATHGLVNRVIYFYSGESLDISGQNHSQYRLAKVKADMELTITNTGSDAKFLVLQGMPIAEPVVQYGPFVMNTKAEIQQAFDDFQKTRFGGWPWDKYDVVHDRSKGRFAKHADGRYEEGA
jgi:redox-sensitive bicupin YhaK (pirin superfamily)